MRVKSLELRVMSFGFRVSKNAFLVFTSAFLVFTSAFGQSITATKAYVDRRYAEVTNKLAKVDVSVKLHALTPEVTDTAVTLKPVDGVANHVGGKVEVEGKSTIVSRSIDISVRVESGYYEPEQGKYPELYSFRVDDAPVEFRIAKDEGEGGSVFVVFTFKERIDVYDDKKNVVGHVPAGAEISAWTYSDDVDFDAPESLNTNINFGGDMPTLVDRVVWDESYVFNGYNYGEQYTSMIQHAEIIPPKSPVVALPASTDTAKSRKFSLAVETNAEIEKAVEWQGGEVIEAVPGASKLVPGLNVWDVAEVAPGKFRVERASSPAQSVPLTLTAPGGRVAELAVNDDLVLEVKEK